MCSGGELGRQGASKHGWSQDRGPFRAGRRSIKPQGSSLDGRATAANGVDDDADACVSLVSAFSTQSELRVCSALSSSGRNDDDGHPRYLLELQLAAAEQEAADAATEGVCDRCTSVQANRMPPTDDSSASGEDNDPAAGGDGTMRDRSRSVVGCV